MKQRVAFAAKNPGYALGLCCQELTLADERFLASITRGGNTTFGRLAGSCVFAGRKRGLLVCAEMASQAVARSFGRCERDFAVVAQGAGANRHFLHDSLHTYEHMLWEFEIAYPFLRLGELLAHDALRSSHLRTSRARSELRRRAFSKAEAYFAKTSDRFHWKGYFCFVAQILSEASHETE